MESKLNHMKLSSAQATKLYELSVVNKECFKDTPGLIHMVDILASILNGCGFCLDMHVKQAKIHGERELRIFHVPIWKESTLFTEKERAAFRWTELMTKLPAGGIPTSELDAALKHFTAKELSDLSYVIITINSWNRLQIATHAIPGSADIEYGLTKAGLN